ncbi:MAG TPA: LysE family transporter [Candidatus Limnocylindria bacterium]|nr:LysE family transporter [Candidatus Limnocylindria bacterium]
MSSFVTGLVAGFAIAMPPGAVTSLIVRIGLARGFRSALAAGWGTATVDGIYGVIAVLAGAAVVPLLGAVDAPFRVVTGLVLIGLGVRGLVTARGEPASAGSPDARDLAATYLRFVAITLVNPATLAYFVAIALGFAGSVLNDAGAFIAGVFVASLTWHAILALTSGSLHGRLSPRARAALTVLANGVVIALGLRILAQVLPG